MANSEGRTTQLHELADNDDNAADVEACIQAGVEVSAVDDDGDTALHIAARAGCTEVCRVLLNNGADVLVRNKKNRLAGGQAKLDEAISELLAAAQEQAKQRRKDRGAALWDSKIQATQTESALRVGTL